MVLQLTLAIAGTITGVILGIAFGGFRILLHLTWRLIKFIFKSLYNIVMFPFRKILEAVNNRNISQLPPERQKQYFQEKSQDFSADMRGFQQQRNIQEKAIEMQRQYEAIHNRERTAPTAVRNNAR